MSSELTKIKDEPIDKGYEIPAESVEPESENATVKSEPKATDEDDDYAWVNDELDFLNEIDDLEVTDDAELVVPTATVSVKQEPGTETASAFSATVSGEDITAPKLDEEAPQEGIQIKVEKGVSDEPGENGEAANNAACPNVSEDAAAVAAATNNEATEAVNSEIANRAGKENDSMNGCASNLNDKDDPCESNTAEPIENNTSEIANSISTSLQLNSLFDSSSLANELTFPVRIKREKLSPPRKTSLLPAPFPAYVSKQPIIPVGFIPLPIIETIPAPPPPLPEEAPSLPPPPPNENSPEIPSFMNGVRVKQERITPPREMTSNKATTEPRSRSKSPKRRRSLSKSPDRQTTSTTKKQSPFDEDAAFLLKQREKILKGARKPTAPSTSGEPSPKRRAISNEIPMPIRIKSEPADDYPTPTSAHKSDCTPIDMELGSDQEQSPAKNPVVKNPLALKLMPQPLKVKMEPMDTYEMGMASTMPMMHSIKEEKFDEKPMSHRQRVLKFARETIKNMELFETVPKLKRRFLYTPTTLIRENAVKLTENRSPLNSITGIQYEFSSQRLPVNTEQWGVCKLREPTAKIVRLLGFNGYEFSQRKKTQKLEKLDPEETQNAPQTDSDAYFVNSSTQTEELKCNRCIIRKLKKFVDRSTQASMPVAEMPMRSSNPLYENIPHEILTKLSELSPAQQTALQEFTELIMGPSLTSTNDVQRMRERLMDIFTLAQSQSGNKGHSNAFEYKSKTPASVLFNQPDHPRLKPMHHSYHGSTGSTTSLGKPIPTLNHQHQSRYQSSAGPPQMQQSQASYHPAPPQPAPMQYTHSAPLFPAAGAPQPVPPPYNAQQVYNPLGNHDYQYQPPGGHQSLISHQQDVGSMPGMTPMVPAMNAFPARQVTRDPRANAHMLSNPNRWS